MAHENFGIVKTIVLPLTIDTLSIDEYKARFGIDLREFISLEGGNLIFDFKNCAFYLSDCGNELKSQESGFLHHMVLPIARYDYGEWASGSTDGYITLGILDVVESGTYGIVFTISKDDDFVIDNLKIHGDAV